VSVIPGSSQGDRQEVRWQCREIGPTYLQLYTPCILEIGKDSMEGLMEMRDSEKPTGRFAYRDYISEPAKQLLADLAAKDKDKKAAVKELVTQEA